MDALHALPTLPDDDDADDAPSPRTGDELPPPDHDTLRTLAAQVGCLTRHDFAALARIKLSTADAWAKRGQGPAYVVLGNARLYPAEAVREFLMSRLRARHRVDPRRLL